MNGFDDLVIARAAAEVAGEGLLDVGLVGGGLFLQ